MANTGPGEHRHLDSRGKWTTDRDPDHVHSYTETPHPADGLTAAEVAGVKALLAAAGGGGGTTPDPNPDPPPTTGPTITNVAVSGITTTAATVSWSVSPNANGQVEYGTTTAYGSQTTFEASYLPGHSQNLGGLLPNTTYHVRVRSQAATGPLSLSSDRTFTTTQTTPTPSPGRPWAAPVAPNVVNVSAGANLQSVVNGAPDGTTCNFPANTLFTVSTGIALNGRDNLVFNLNGSTIKSTGAGNSVPASPFYLTNGSTHITISNGTLNGSNPDTGSGIYHAGQEYLFGVASYGTQYLELDRVRIRNTWGDFLYLSGGSAHVWAHDGDWDYCGRMGVAFIECSDVLVERNRLDHVALIAFDIEPNDTGAVLDAIHIQDNTVGQWSLSNYQTNWFFAYATPKGVGSNIFVERNVCTLGPVAGSNNPAGKGGLATNVQHPTIAGLTFRGNSTPVSGKSGLTGYPSVLYFTDVTSLVVTGNTQPLAAGSTLIATVRCPGAVTSPNP